MASVKAQAAVFVMPPSPSDTNPPLGPAILARRAHEAGLTVSVWDLNIEFINSVRGHARREEYSAVGDQGKDRSLVARSAAVLFSQFGIPRSEVLFCPDVGDPNAGMHFTAEGVQDAVQRHVHTESLLAQWIDSKLDELERDGWPSLVGVSIMGPSQVLASLLLLALVKRRRPTTATVVGGSHVTLLEKNLRVDSRMRSSVDFVMAGHCEADFARLVAGAPFQSAPSISAARVEDGPEFPYLPLFQRRQLAMYASQHLVLPVQFTRGCQYGRCTYCTYPVVEPHVTRMFAGHARQAMVELHRVHGARRFSLKDSLLTAPAMSELAHELLALGGPKIEWSATTKVVRGLIDQLPLLAESGLRTLELGVESIHARSLEIIDKRSSRSVVEEVVAAAIDNGVVPVVNLMFGFPGESEREAHSQLDWAHSLRDAASPGQIEFSMNLLEVVRGSAMALDTRVETVGIAPWAYCYEWNAPKWRPSFAPALLEFEAR